MKKTFKVIALVLSVVMMMAAFASCSGNDNKDETSTDAKNTDKTLKIGIIQYMSHPSLDNCYQGIKEALDASGLKFEIDYQTGSSASADSDCASFAKNMVAANVDMIFAIATPAAKACIQRHRRHRHSGYLLRRQRSRCRKAGTVLRSPRRQMHRYIRCSRSRGSGKHDHGHAALR